MTDQPADPGAEPCEDCAPGRGRAILLAFAFAAFAAYVAADFVTGGKLTAWTVATLAGLRGKAGGET